MQMEAKNRKWLSFYDEQSNDSNNISINEPATNTQNSLQIRIKYKFIIQIVDNTEDYLH